MTFADAYDGYLAQSPPLIIPHRSTGGANTNAGNRPRCRKTMYDASFVLHYMEVL